MEKSISSTETADVVIIGGGVIGLTIARALALRGMHNVTLFERAGLGKEASFAAAGMLAPQAEADRGPQADNPLGVVDASDDFFRLTCQSRDMYGSFAAALREETGTDIELDTTGTLYLAFTEHDQEEINKRYDWQTRAGLAVEKLSEREARELETCITPSLLAALRFPKDVQVENRRLLTALASSVQRLGVKTITETKVNSLRIEQGRLTGVETSRGFVGCPSVIVASGSWTSFIGVSGKGSNESLRLLPRVQIEPVRGQMVCFDSKPQLTRHVIYSPRGYIVPRRDGRLLAGSTSEAAGFAKQVTAGGIGSILSHAMEIAPGISTLPMIDSWAGLRPRAADGLPVLGPCDEIEGLFYATGHYRNGILLAPITGELIAQAVIDRVISPSLVPFSPNRFDLVR
jgi:glycine oxidase